MRRRQQRSNGNGRKRSEAIGDASKKLLPRPKDERQSTPKNADIDRVVGGRAAAVVGGVFSGESLWSAIKIGIAFLILSAIGVALMGET